jgi:hypothetical protein
LRQKWKHEDDAHQGGDGAGSASNDRALSAGSGLPGETDVRDGRRAHELDGFVARRSAVEMVEEALTAAQEDGDDRDVQFVDQAGAEVLLDGGRATAEPDILPLGGVERSLQRGVDAVVDVVPPFIVIGGRGWCVSTNTGWRKGGLSPHQPGQGR